MTVLLEGSEIRVEPSTRSRANTGGEYQSFVIELRNGGAEEIRAKRAAFAWTGEQELRGVSNYLIGSDPKKWHVRVPHYVRAEATEALPGVSVEAYGNQEGMEYDLRVAPGTNAASLRLEISGVGRLRLTSDGDLLLGDGASVFLMKRPEIYEEWTNAGTSREAAWKRVNGGYVIEADGSVGFRIGRHDATATLVIDPSLSVSFASFLGGTGESAAQSVAVDPEGNVYVAGTTPSPVTFPETGAKQIGPGPVNGTSGTVPEFFVAKINPTGGADSLVYLTFIGGSGIQTGGIIAVDPSGDVFLTGTTTSGDYPVTDGSKLTPGPNDVVMSEIEAGGSTLEFSTLFGGSESESQNSTGGIALDATGNVYVVGDTNSTDLPVTPATTTTTTTTGAYQTTFPAGAVSDGFLAIFTPGATPSLKYCTYLGVNASAGVGVGGVAVDTATPADAYIVGFTSNTISGFPAKNGFQAAYGGGTYNAFLMQISPAGNSTADLVYGTLLGGSVMDQALAVAVDGATPPNVYLTGTTQSKDFPVKGAIAAYQASLSADSASDKTAANAFLSVITQIPATGMTKLVYSTYLGGTQTDTGQAVAVASPTAVYVAGTTSSWNFPWKDNLQPFNGTQDAFIAKMDPQVGGTASLIYATPLGGTAPPGTTVNAAANAIAIGGTGLVYVGGETTAADFPTAVSTSGIMNGFQAFCESCAASPVAAEAFVAGIQENAQAEPSVYFNAARVNFPAAVVGTVNTPQLVAVFNGGEAPLNISSFTIVGTNSSDFSLEFAPGACTTAGNPGATPVCSFEVGFTPSVAGPETAVVSFTDNAPGSPQALELIGAGEGLLATPGKINFGNVPVGSVSPDGTTTLSNTSANEIQITSIALSGPDALQFALDDSKSKCPTPLSPGDSCTLAYNFAPNAARPFQAQALVSYQIVGAGSTTYIETVLLAGVGTAPTPLAQVEPSNLTFGTVSAGTTSGAQQVTLTNNGGATLNLTGISIMGTNAADFTIVPVPTGDTACPLGAGTLGFGNPPPSCVVSVKFTPQAGDSAGVKSALLNFADNAPGNPQTVALGGTATAPPPPLQVSPSSLAFGAESEGTSSMAQTVTITNPADGISANMTGISIAGTNKGDFVLKNPCATPFAAGSTCEVSVSFSPAISQPGGSRSATLNVPGGNPSTVPLSGTATVAGISVVPSLGFAPAAACGPSATCAAGTPVPLTVNSTGTGPLTFYGVSVGTPGSNAGDFILGQDTCTAASTAPGTSCTIQVTFAPACVNVPAARNATLTLMDNAPPYQQTITLSGMATGEFCFDPPPSNSTTPTVTQGYPGIFSLELLSPIGVAGTITLTCTVKDSSGNTVTNPPCDVPAVVTTTTNPPTCSQPMTATVTLSSAPANFVACLPTTAPSSMLLREGPGGRRPLGLPITLPATLLLIALMVAAVAGSVAGKRGRCLARLAQGAALLLLLGACIGACGGGGGGSTATPTGTYTVTVTASDGTGTPQSTQLTFCVSECSN